MALQYAQGFHGQAFVEAAGLLHDIGKYDPAFQQYLLTSEATPGKRYQSPDHKHAGAVYAAMHMSDPAASLLALLIAGHHGGLPEKAHLFLRLREHAQLSATQHALATAMLQVPELGHLPTTLLPSFVCTPMHSMPSNAMPCSSEKEEIMHKFHA